MNTCIAESTGYATEITYFSYKRKILCWALTKKLKSLQFSNLTAMSSHEAHLCYFNLKRQNSAIIVKMQKMLDIM